MEIKDFICENVSRDEEGNLLFAGQKTKDLAEKYGTPVYLMDEDRIRNRMQTYVNAANEAFPNGGAIALASKAASFKHIYEIAKEEGMWTDVVSSGEIYVADLAGFPLEKSFFHSNNKTDEDIQYAMDKKVGYFVIDNIEEAVQIDKFAKERNIKQKALIRITPGIDSHTLEAISTGKVDSKFGQAIETGQADVILEKVLSLDGIDLKGFHCHVGSQVFDSEVFFITADIMMGYIASAKEKYGFEASVLNLGGGYGVRYTKDDPHIDIAENIKGVGEHIVKKAEELNIKIPMIAMEPGRSIVADAGMTLYKVGSVKKIPGYKTYVSVDGGMTDNVRTAMYDAAYTIFPCTGLDETDTMEADVVGRCCESGDIIQRKITLPSNIKRGDLIATLTTGAYHYTMASNYNRIPKLPIVMLKEGTSFVAVKRETIEDLARFDV